METSVHDLSTRLSDRGFKVGVAVNHHRILCQETQIYRNLQLNRLRRWGSLQNVPLAFWRLFFKSSLFKWNIAHIHLPNPLALNALVSNPIKKVATIHAYPGNHPYLAPLYRPLFSRQISQIDKVVFTSESLKQSFLKKGFDWARAAQVINLGIADNCDAKDREHELSEHPRLITEDLLFVGRLVKYKGLPVLLRALAQLPKEICLSVVGKGPERRSWEQMAYRLGVNSRVIFHGELSSFELRRAYDRCRLVILPSINECEAFGLSLVEGLRSGKPLISTALNTGVIEVNLSGVTGLTVNAFSSNEMAQAIAKILYDKDLYATLSKQARRHYLNNFQIERMINGYERVYRELLADK